MCSLFLHLDVTCLRESCMRENRTCSLSGGRRPARKRASSDPTRHPALPSNGTVEHPTKCGAIDRSRMDAETNDPACVLIHDHKDPVGPQRSRFAPEQIHAPEAVFRVPQESQPGRTTRVLSRPVVTSENPANYVFVDLDVERQSDLLGDSRTAPIGITLLHFDHQMDEFCAGSFRAGLPMAIR